MTFDQLTGEALNLELNSSDSNVLFTAARRQQGVNDGIQEFARLTKCYVRTLTVSLSCSVTEYDISSRADFTEWAAQGLPEYRVTDSNGALTVLAGEDFPRRDEVWLNRYQTGWRASTACGMPTAWYQRLNAGSLLVGLDTPPDLGSSETGQFVAPYVARPVTLAASTQVPFTDTAGVTRPDLVPYHQAAAHYAAYKLLPLQGKWQDAADQLGKFSAYVSQYVQAQRPKGGTHITLGRSYLQQARRTAARTGEWWESV